MGSDFRQGTCTYKAHAAAHLTYTELSTEVLLYKHKQTVTITRNLLWSASFTTWTCDRMTNATRDKTRAFLHTIQSRLRYCYNSPLEVALEASDRTVLIVQNTSTTARTQTIEKQRSIVCALILQTTDHTFNNSYVCVTPPNTPPNTPPPAIITGLYRIYIINNESW